jgi:hypothetical protein
LCRAQEKKRRFTVCAPLQHQKASDHVEINGLKLGISRNDVLKILGEATKKTPNEWTYDFRGDVREDSGAGASGFGKGQEYSWQLLIKISFEDSAVSRIEVSPSARW